MALAWADPLAVRWGIVALIVTMLTLLISGWRYPGKPTVPVTVGVGGVAGFFGGLAQLGGPPIVMYWLRDAQSLPSPAQISSCISRSQTS